MVFGGALEAHSFKHHPKGNYIKLVQGIPFEHHFCDVCFLEP